MQLGDIDLAATPAHRRAHLGIGFMPEDRRLVPELTAEENILLPVWATGADNARDRLQWIYGLMPEVEEFRHRGATALSGGQQKFVAFARALMCGTRLLLLDEPGEGIAPIFAQRMVEILDDLKKEGGSVLVAESNDVHIAGLLDRTFVIERGSIVEGRLAATTRYCVRALAPDRHARTRLRLPLVPPSAFRSDRRTSSASRFRRGRSSARNWRCRFG